MAEKKYLEYKIYPFLYSIIPSSIVNGVPILASGLPDPNGFDPNGINRNYLTINAGQVLESPINLQQDKNHFINYYKFIAYSANPVDGFLSPYLHEVASSASPSIPAPWVAYGMTDPSIINYLDYLKIQMIIDSRGSIIIQDLLSESSQQTKYGGMGMIRKPFFVPRVSTVSIKIQNTFNQPIYLAGSISTYKSTV